MTACSEPAEVEAGERRVGRSPTGSGGSGAAASPPSQPRMVDLRAQSECIRIGYLTPMTGSLGTQTPKA
jgi:hypothetical protein